MYRSTLRSARTGLPASGRTGWSTSMPTRRRHSPQARSSAAAARALASALSVLNDRERRIFEARRLAEGPITLKELADEFGVSRERVRQIGVCAFEKVQKSVKNRFALMETSATLPAH